MCVGMTHTICCIALPSTQICVRISDREGCRSTQRYREKEKVTSRALGSECWRGGDVYEERERERDRKCKQKRECNHEENEGKRGEAD